MKRHLEPLAIAANITQASFCRIDQVLLTFGFLVMQYRALTDPDDLIGCNAIINSIEQRWAKADQDVFIAAVILNPFFRSSPFAPLPSFNNAGIHKLFRDLWLRFYSQEPPLDFTSHADEYLRGTGMFANLQTHCEIKRVNADRKVWTISTSLIAFLP
jgi:hypothetical protein